VVVVDTNVGEEGGPSAPASIPLVLYLTCCSVLTDILASKKERRDISIGERSEILKLWGSW